MAAVTRANRDRRSMQQQQCRWSTHRHRPVELMMGKVIDYALQEWAKAPTANPYADGQMSVPSV
jgi:hypothetical protein